MLFGLAAIAPAALCLGSTAAWAQADADPLLEISRIIVGTNDLSASVAAGIRGLLAARMEDFAGRLVELTNDMRTSNGRNRDAVLALLSDDQVQFALEIAKPWYLGYVGSHSDFVLGDDAAFATLPEAQSWQKIILEFPRIT